MGYGRASVAIVTLLITFNSVASLDFSRRQIIDQLRAAKRNKCAEVSTQCFSTSHCCDGLVCVSVDDYLGEKPEAPGSCVKEKDLRECTSSSDCQELGTSCRALGRSSSDTLKYCTPSTRPGAGTSSHALAQYSQSEGEDPAKGSLGSSCHTTSDCRMMTYAGETQLCCKDVHRGRLGVRRQCDRVHTSGACIGPPRY